MTATPDEAQQRLNDLGAAVHDVLERWGISRKRLGERGGFDYRAFGRLEDGRPVKPATLRRVAALFGVPPELMVSALTSSPDLERVIALLRGTNGPADDEGSVIDPVDLSDAQLLAQLRLLTSELETRLIDRGVKLTQLTDVLTSKGGASQRTVDQISNRITEQLRKDE